MLDPYARPPTTPAEERTLRRLDAARHAPASLIQRARSITASWDGASVTQVAQSLGCHPKTVSKWLHRFNLDPDRLSFIRSLRVIRRQVIAAPAVFP